MPELMHQQLLTSTLEFIAKQAIALDPKTQQSLSALNGKSMTVILDELGFPLCFTVSDSAVLVTSRQEEQCVIQCNLAALSKMKDASALTQMIKDDELVLAGDINIAQQFSAIAQQLNIDWSGELAKRIGDVPTHKFTQLANSLLDKMRFAKQQIQQDSSEWLLHEVKAAAHKTQVADFNLHVEKLEQQANKLAVRIAKLSNSIDRKTREN